MITLHSLQSKDIVYIDDGYKIGNLTDIEIEVSSGRVTAIVIATKTKVFGVFGEEQEIIIPWEHVMKIGYDIILVKKATNYLSEVNESMYPYNQ